MPQSSGESLRPPNNAGMAAVPGTSLAFAFWTTLWTWDPEESIWI